MFVGRVLEIGEDLRAKIDLRVGERIASLVSLTLTPLYIESVRSVDVATGRIRVHGKAILFESALWARLPADIDEGVALAVLDVAGAPAQVRRLCSPGETVVIIGADGKSGLLSCAQAKAERRQSGPRDRSRTQRLDAVGATAAAGGTRRRSRGCRRAQRSRRLGTRYGERPRTRRCRRELRQRAGDGTRFDSLRARRRHRLFLFDGDVVHRRRPRRRRRRPRRNHDDRQRLHQRTRRRRVCRPCAIIPRLHAYFNATYATMHPEPSKDKEHGHDHHDGDPSHKSPGPARAVRVQETQTGRVLAAHPGVRGDRRSDVSRPSLAAAPIGENGGRAAPDDSRRLLADILSRRRRGFSPGSDGGARFALRDRADRLERSDERPDSTPVRSAGLGPAAGPSPLDARFFARTTRFTGAWTGAPLRRQSALSAAQRLSGLLSLLHSQLRDRPRHRKRRQSRACQDAQAVAGRVPIYLRSGRNSKTS